jgi:hypothetical protein
LADDINGQVSEIDRKVGSFQERLLPMIGTAVGASCNPLHDGWQLTLSLFFYLAYCIVAALVLRAVGSIFRALAVQKGDFPHEKDESHSIIANFGTAFWYSFSSCNPFKHHRDLWIPFVINVIEFAAYPVLFALNRLEIVGAWIALKATGQWAGWRLSRTSFNRFLLLTLVTVLVAFYLSPILIHVKPCGP